MEKVTVATAMQKFLHKQISLNNLYFYIEDIGYLQTDEIIITGDIILHNNITDEEIEVNGEDYVYLI